MSQVKIVYNPLDLVQKEIEGLYIALYEPKAETKISISIKKTIDGKQFIKLNFDMENSRSHRIDIEGKHYEISLIERGFETPAMITNLQKVPYYIFEVRSRD